jgi:general L-amino acid transport system substrate-binding protein
MSSRRFLFVLGVTLGVTVAAPVTLAAGGLVEQVRERGELRCGVSMGIPGFAEQDAAGAWRGIEADYCRALAAAVIGDAQAVRFVPLEASARFPTLKLARIDVLLASTSWTLSREALLGVRFAAALFHDGQSFMVPAASSAQDPRDLAGLEVCVEKHTTHSARLRAFAQHGATNLRVREAASATAAAADFFAGRCAALSTESAQLAALRHLAGADAAAYRTLPRAISREVLSAVVRDGDPAWETVVRWAVYALLLAEETGLDSRAAAIVAANGTLPEVAKAWGVTQADEYLLVARALGVEPGWMTRAVAAAGNYQELFARNLGSDSPLELERGPNRLAGAGGLLFAPPLR